MQTTVKILGGLEVTVEFTACGADRSVGIMSDYAEDWHIVEIAGRPLRKGEKCDWLYKRIEAKKGEEDSIIEACCERMEAERHYFEQPDDF